MHIIKLVGNIQSPQHTPRQSKFELFVGPTERHADCEAWLLKKGFVSQGTGNSSWKRNGKARVHEYENHSTPTALQAKIIVLRDLNAVHVGN